MISLMFILLTILVVIVLVLVVLIIHTWRYSLAKNGTRIYKIDLDKMIMQRGENKFIVKSHQLFKSFKFKQNVEKVAHFQTIFSNSSLANKEFSESLAKLKSKKPEFYQRKFVSTVPKMRIGKKTKFSVNFSFWRQDEHSYFFNCSWIVVEKQRFFKHLKTKKITTTTITTIKDLIKGNRHSIGFVAFNLKNNSSECSFIDFLSIYWKRKIKYIFNSPFLIFVFQSKKNSSTKRQMKKMTNLFSKKMIFYGAKKFYWGTSCVLTKYNRDGANIDGSLRLLEYLSAISSEQKIDFVTPDSGFFNLEEFQDFVVGYKKSHEIINGNIDNLKIAFNPIKLINSNRKMDVLAIPKIDDVSANIQNKLLRNTVISQKLTNTLAVQIATKNDKNKLLVNVSDYWITENYAIIKNKKPIYVINFTSNDSIAQLTKVAPMLIKHGLSLGLKIRRYDGFSNIITVLEPKVVVIDERFFEGHDILDSLSHTYLLTVVHQTKKLKSRIIYEKPPIKRMPDPETCKNIQLKYVYY